MNKVKKNPLKKDYEELLNIEDEKINVLVMGTTSCGKSTLIETIMDVETNDSIQVYEKDDIPFRLIDSIGFDHGFMKQLPMKMEMNKWLRKGMKSKDHSSVIHAIWYCIGSDEKMDNRVLDSLRRVSNTWKNVPIIVVLTKAFHLDCIEKNEDSFKRVFNEYRRKDKFNIKGIVSVVAKSIEFEENVFVPCMNLDVLVEQTIQILPEAKRIGNSSIKGLDLSIKKSMANSVVVAATSSAAIVGAVPIPIPDASVLLPIQMFMLQRVSNIYKIENKSLSNEIIDYIIKIEGTTFVAKQVLNYLKSIPQLNLLGDVLNAVVAGVITFISGEISITIFERVYRGDLDYLTTDWESEIGSLFKEKLPDVLRVLKPYLTNNKKFKVSDLGDILMKLMSGKK